MNAKQIVKFSNGIGVIAIILLTYWVFTFIMIQVFGLRVFKENTTETFYFSIFGILALMTGSLMVNIMLNLTRIAEKHNQDNNQTKQNKRIFIFFLLIFPLIATVLFYGDYLTSKNKGELLINSAKSIIESNKINGDKLVDYAFSKEYITETKNILSVLSATDADVPNITLIVKDTINDSPVFLSFSDNSYGGDTIKDKKEDYIYKTTQPEREYLNKVFDENNDELKYISDDGNYELFYPYKKGNKRIVLHFSEHKRYGNFGS